MDRRDEFKSPSGESTANNIWHAKACPSWRK